MPDMDRPKYSVAERLVRSDSSETAITVGRTKYFFFPFSAVVVFAANGDRHVWPPLGPLDLLDVLRRRPLVDQLAAVVGPVGDLPVAQRLGRGGERGNRIVAIFVPHRARDECTRRRRALLAL